ncbi:hypothetical protein D0T50_13705, partial [Bacteroides sp. 214]|nr:hypothetical protein [Bacteroides sp. 214]
KYYDAKEGAKDKYPDFSVNKEYPQVKEAGSNWDEAKWIEETQWNKVVLIPVVDNQADFYFLAPGKYCARLVVDNSAIFPSKGEMRKLVQSGGVSLNKEK